MIKENHIFISYILINETTGPLPACGFGSGNVAPLDVIFGKYKTGGRLPIEMPSMEAVHNQKENMPHDSKDPLYKFGYGLSY